MLQVSSLHDSLPLSSLPMMNRFQVTSRNDDLDRLRLAATSNLVSRRDVLLVASVSCIFGLGSPETYKSSVLSIRKDIETDRDEMLRKLIDLQYARNDMDFKRATF